MPTRRALRKAPCARAWTARKRHRRWRRGAFAGTRPRTRRRSTKSSAIENYALLASGPWWRRIAGKNAARFERVSAEIAKRLRKLPPHLLGKNGERFLETSLKTTALIYAWIQIMRGGTRTDPEHYDGGASIFAGGLTIFGRRRVDYCLDDKWEPSEQKPGDFYMGSLCSPLHRVAHSEEEDRAEDLFWDGSEAKEGLKIVIIFRSDHFAANRGRAWRSKPSPTVVYDIVNHALNASFLADSWEMPSFAEVVQELGSAASDEEDEQNEEEEGGNEDGKREENGESCPSAASAGETEDESQGKSGVLETPPKGRKRIRSMKDTKVVMNVTKVMKEKKVMKESKELNVKQAAPARKGKTR